MRLSRFITEHMEAILQEWEDFARTLNVPTEPLSRDELRDHAGAMLEAIAADLETEQTPEQQIDKSKGKGNTNEHETAAQEHALTRLTAGFTLNQLVSEFRALRASVLRQWMSSVNPHSPHEIEDMVRFNEAIDQALCESIARYAEAAEASRDMFLGILGHDLRTPLGAILLAADVLLRTDELGAKATKLSSRIYTSVKRANRIVSDLLDLTRSQLGGGIPVYRDAHDLAPICEQIVDEASTFHPESEITLLVTGSALGQFDAARIEQVFSNLISNAVHHGDKVSPVSVILEGLEKDVVFSVHNYGAPIPEDVLPLIFHPLERYSQSPSVHQSSRGGLGLGLYIASQIVNAHRGRIDVVSDNGGTKFTVRLPKNT
jgi:signal transduction histidine kinase